MRSVLLVGKLHSISVPSVISIQMRTSLSSSSLFWYHIITSKSKDLFCYHRIFFISVKTAYIVPTRWHNILWHSLTVLLFYLSHSKLTRKMVAFSEPFNWTSGHFKLNYTTYKTGPSLSRHISSSALAQSLRWLQVAIQNI